MITAACEDCMDMMARYPGKYFDLAVTDPPYGIGEDWKKRRGGNKYAGTAYKNEPPPPEYFAELERVSKERIIFGYNYFTEYLGPTNYLIVWDKMSSSNGVFCYSQIEIAYTTIHKPAQLISIPWDGYRMGKETGTRKIHPHQKPVELYKKILQKYARPGWKIVETHGGSFSIAIACEELGFDLTVCEIDRDYYDNGMERLREYRRQGRFCFEEGENAMTP
jgi:site-specific DNA-methyltransferase (adenine-specific)